ncbi:MAG: hypothetical protein IJ195_10190 [Lachnospiraceae bacterium]|nr:hypothetical protein [Lachnospiraceae bacterium]
MSIKLSQEIVDAINNPTSIKVIASKDRFGTVNVVAKGSIRVTEDGKIRVLELLESAQSNKNLTYSLWFNQTVAINVITTEKKSYQVKGVPVKAVIHGHEFEEAYKEVIAKDPENDLAAIYYIEPELEKNETYTVRREEQKKEHPLYFHIDKIAKAE